ncbi:Lon protease family protein [Thermocrinis jamiesonii]|uniref:Lon protease family protein n=1 Tax=Thermocrinis jamiesonii TaxID=1302351 RepID=UPI000496E19C|nr:ATP-binding protein [Thermocrinis jamiesonii]
MSVKKLSRKDLEYGYAFKVSTSEVEPEELFLKQYRVEKAFDLALSTTSEGYNLFISGPESVGRTTYALRRLKEKAQTEPVPEDLCYVYNFDDPLRPKYLLLPAGVGRGFVEEIERIVELLKTEIPKAFESKEYEEEVARITKEIEKKKEEILTNLAKEAEAKNLGVVVTSMGIKLLPIVGRRIVEEPELFANPKIQESFQKNLSEFEEQFRDYIRELREADHELIEKLRKLKEKVATFVVEKLFSKCDEKYCKYPTIAEFLERLKREIVKSVDLFLMWKSAMGNTFMLTYLEKAFRKFKINLIVDNSELKGAPVIYEEVPSFQSLFGSISYSMEMGVLYADHTSIKAGSLHKARGGYLLLRVSDLLKNYFLWDAFKKAIMHSKVHIPGYALEDLFLSYIGISPEPIPIRLKVVLIGDYLTYQLLSLYDPEFRRLFKIKAEFDPVVDLDQEVYDKFPRLVKKIIQDEGIKDLEPEALSELFKHAVTLSGSTKKISIVMGDMVDIMREANTFAGEDKLIRREHIKRAIEEKFYRSNLIEEKIRKAILEGKIICSVKGKSLGQVNGLSVYELGDISFGKPTRITASVYPGEKGVVSIEKEVALSGPIHSKAVLTLSGYLNGKYGKEVPLYLSCTLTFEQSYEEVEGDSASVAELLAILSAIAEVPVRQDIAVTGSIDQFGNVQPVGGIKEKVEGFYKVCKALGFTGTQGVIVPSKNWDNLVLSDDVLESVEKGEFHIYLIDTVDDAIELMTEMNAEKFHKLVKKRLMEFYKKITMRRDKV